MAKCDSTINVTVEYKMNQKQIDAVKLMKASMVAIIQCMDIIIDEAQAGAPDLGDKQAPHTPPVKDAPIPDSSIPSGVIGPETRKALGNRMRELSLKHGNAAQDAFKKILINLTGTQALSQVKDENLADIANAVEKWNTKVNG